MLNHESHLTALLQLVDNPVVALQRYESSHWQHDYLQLNNCCFVPLFNTGYAECRVSSNYLANQPESPSNVALKCEQGPSFTSIVASIIILLRSKSWKWHQLFLPPLVFVSQLVIDKVPGNDSLLSINCACVYTL